MKRVIVVVTETFTMPKPGAHLSVLDGKCALKENQQKATKEREKLWSISLTRKPQCFFV